LGLLTSREIANLFVFFSSPFLVSFFHGSRHEKTPSLLLPPPLRSRFFALCFLFVVSFRPVRPRHEAPEKTPPRLSSHRLIRLFAFWGCSLPLSPPFPSRLPLLLRSRASSSPPPAFFSSTAPPSPVPPACRSRWPVRLALLRQLAGVFFLSRFNATRDPSTPSRASAGPTHRSRARHGQADRRHPADALAAGSVLALAATKNKRGAI
jgi:hypothetical protein